MRPSSHDHCLLCGDRNPIGLGLRFFPTGPKSVQAEVTTHRLHEGYKGILHGGVVAALLDSAMCNAVFQQGSEAVTADMSIRYHKEIPRQATLQLHGRITQSRGPIFRVEAQLIHNNQIVAESQARFFKRNP